MIKKMLIVLTMFCFITLSSCKKSQIVNDYPSLNQKDNIVRYTNIDEVLTKIDSNYNGIITFGFKVCPWCQAAIFYINEIAKEKDYKEVLYLDIKDMRDNTTSVNHEKYLTLFEKIKTSIGEPTKIFAPTVIVIKNGIIASYNVGTVESHQKVEGVLPPMTEQQIQELREIYRSMF